MREKVKSSFQITNDFEIEENQKNTGKFYFLSQINLI